MTTRSAIGYKTPTGIRAAYCHYDGYVAHNGKVLQEHYQDPEKVAQLIEQGDMSSLAPEVWPTAGSDHSFETPEHGVVVYYRRDRGETQAKTAKTKQFADLKEFEMEMEHLGCEYFYVFDGSEWSVSTGDGVFSRVQVQMELI